MTTKVVDTVKITTADDLEDLLSILQNVLQEVGPATGGLDTVFLTQTVKVDILRNILTDYSHTFDLRFSVIEEDQPIR